MKSIKWYLDPEINIFEEIKNIKPSDFTAGVILNSNDNDEQDIHFPLELHNKLKDYPLLPEYFIPKKEELSHNQKKLIAKEIVKYLEKSK